MKKSIKRILCGVMSLAMCSTMVLEGALRLTAEKQPVASTTASASTAFTNVTGKYDTSKLREQYFNNSVVKTEDTAPVYETRTVVVTLSGKTIVERSGNEQVADYLETWSGNLAKASLKTEQTNFLQALTKKGIAYKLEHSYTNVLNGVAIEIDTKYVSQIKEMNGVESVVITTAYEAPQTVETKTAHSDVVTNETEVYETGIYDSSKYASYGEGMVVAVLDTGLDYTHSAFQQFQSDNVKFSWTKDVVKNKINTLNLAAEVRSGTLDVSDVYMNDKVPFAYDYADDDADVYPSYSNHGTHVAGIIGGYDPSGYTDKDGNPITDKQFLGVVPDAQLMICKVFTDDLDDPDLGGAVSEDIVAALEDCVTLGVDVINMSLGSSCGFTTTNDGDDEGEMLNRVYESIGEKGISLICAASNDYSAGYGGVYGTNLAENPDAGTVGSPSTYASALSVASINGQPASYLVINSDNENISNPYVFFEEARDINSNELDFVGGLNELYPSKKGEFEYVVVPGTGSTSDFSSVAHLFRDNNNPRIALVKRGDTTFKEKVEAAMDCGAKGIIVYNNVAGVIRMNLGEVDNPIPAISISLNAGNNLLAGATENGNKIGKISIDASYAAGPFMSEFSSWGPTPDLRLKPEITAHGGEITSAVPGGYGEQSGTSMATPNMAGFMAIVRSYIESNSAMASLIKTNGKIDPVKVNRLAMQLTMSTAGMVYDQDELPYSPRKQGAGVAKLDNVIDKTSAFLSTDNAENDYRPKVELGDDKDKKGEYTVTFNVTNFGSKTLNFTLDSKFMTETLASNHLTVDEQAYMLNDSSVAWSVDGKSVKSTKLSVAAGITKKITAVFTLGDKDREYIDNSFKNGMYVEGFVNLISDDATQCDLVLPFLGFYGDWDQAPMLDYSVYEVAENAQDASVLERDKIKASVWETQPFNMYYNDKYILPMGSYVYTLPEDLPDSEKMYANEEYNSVSRYNEYFGEGEAENYMTSTGIKAVYAGLLRNARYVKYRLIDETTGELLKSDYMNRVAKAYAGGGSAIPANVELELLPEEEGLLANGRYRMEFEFFGEGYRTDKTGTAFEEYLDSLTAAEENTFKFSFTVDYDAPVMEDARVRFYNYKDGKIEKQKVYMDIDVYDNHYAQTIMLCYPKKNTQDELVLQLATEYPTPIRKAVKNGITTVSIEITDIYEEYGDNLYIQLDDYALNTCLYQIDAKKAQTSALPAANDFALAEGEETINLDIYGTHKVSLVYGEEYKDCNLSNFTWRSDIPAIADVKNGEIVGLSEGTARIAVTGKSGAPKIITVNVSGNYAELTTVPDISLGTIKTDNEALVKAEGTVDVAAGQTFTMKVITDPWYHPMTGLRIVWSSSNPEIATVDANTGEVKTIKEGTTNISATVYQGNQNTRRTATVKLSVQDDYTVSNYTLSKYNGLGYTVDDEESIKKLPEWDTPLTAEDGTLRIPTYLNVMYIGSEAFKDNSNVKKLIIPSSVIEIRERAFLNCTALEEVYFVSDEERPIADSDLSMIYENAFEGCINLKKISFINVKTATIAADCFTGCTNLAEVEGMEKIGTIHHRAFAGTALKEVNLSGLHMSGNNVFSGCQNLETVITGKFTAIGKEMFSEYKPYGAEKALYPACTSLKSVTLHTSKIGEGAFAGCTALTEVIFDAADASVEFSIGDNAFRNSGLKNIYFGSAEKSTAQTIRAIGSGAFAGTALTQFNFGMVKGLEVLGENAFANTAITQITLSDDMDFENLRLAGVPFNAKLTVKVASNSTKYTQDTNGVIYNRAKTKILYIPASRTGSYTVDSSVTAIGDYAFAGAKYSKVTLHSGVTKLGVGAFENAQLSNIDFAGAAITEIPEDAFAGSNITTISLPNTVKKLGAYAFADSHLTSFTGSNVLTVDDYAFAQCKALKSVKLAAGNGSKDNASFGDGVFSGSAIEEITLPSLKEMGYGTFIGATKLKKVTFGSNATTIGEMTFAYTSVSEVVLSDKIEKIGEGVFYNCRELKSIDLKNVTEIGAQVFAGCTALSEVKNIENVTDFGAYSFYNTSLGELKLTSATHIGAMAFAFESNSQDETAKYTALSIPAVEEIGNFAFFNSGLESVELPATLQKMGMGVFASSDKLTTITVAEGNKIFFVDNGALYRNVVNEEKTVYELVLYPTALVQEGEKGARKYSIKEGTARILAYSFAQINKDTINAVWLPYSVKIVGDGAFFNSGITTYTFESIQAPILETSYNETIRENVNMNNLASEPAEYKGYFYTNFETEFYPYSFKGNQTSTLTMNYPRNGVGYDNPIYSRYFGVRNASEKDLTEDDTREFINYIDKLISVEEILSWIDKDNQQAVIDYENHMQSVRETYKRVKTDSVQLALVEEWRLQKLNAVEKAMSEAKEYFGLIFEIANIEVAEDSEHRAEYEKGETFDLTGLKAIIYYEDGSTAEADPSLFIVETGEITSYTKTITIRYEDTKFYVDIKVKVDEKPTDSNSSSSEEVPDVNESSKTVIIVMAIVADLVVVGLGVFFFLRWKKGKAAKQTAETEVQPTETLQTAQDVEEKATEGQVEVDETSSEKEEDNSENQ